MKIAYLQICKLLASSGFREREITDFAHTLIEVGPIIFAEDVASLKHWLSSVPSGRVYDVPSATLPMPQSEAVAKIERLLIGDAGMPRALAIEQLTAELRARFPSVIVPSESRKGFQTWIKKLTALVPEKELLHLATNLRNRYVHDEPSDWRLR